MTEYEKLQKAKTAAEEAAFYLARDVCIVICACALLLAIFF